jgi:predicted dehydrogenase/nucleoside-diphosphate-sugar epimerase
VWRPEVTLDSLTINAVEAEGSIAGSASDKVVLHTSAIPQSSMQVKSDTKAQPLRLLILGGGAVVSEFYLPALARLDWMAGITVSDTSSAALAQVSKRAPWVSTVIGNYSEILSDIGLRSTYDAVVVALPNNLHAPAVLAALEAGFPVLCEKPLALTAEDCRLLSNAATKKKLPLVVGMVRRLTPAAQAACSALNAHLIGALEEVVVDHGGPYSWTSDSGAFFKRENGGILADLGVHHLDWLAEILGPLAPVSYMDDARGGVEASCNYELRNEQGVRVTLRLSHRHQRSNKIIFNGTNGKLILDKDNFASCILQGIPDGVISELTPEKAFVDQSWPRDFISCFAQQFNDFAATVQRASAPAVTADQAVATMTLIEHAYNSRPTSRPLADDGRPILAQGRVVVSGGTGFIGTALIERLAEIGFDDLIVPVRGYRTTASVARFPVMLPRVDLSNRSEVREMVRGARWVFHLAYGQHDADAKRITVDGTRMVVEEAAAAGAEAIVVLSTMYVFGHPRTDALVDESWPYDPAGGIYGKTKMMMERWCLQHARDLGRTRLVVLNPSCVFGPEGKTYTRLPEELARKGQFAWVDEGRGTANYVYIDNLIDAMLLIAAHSDAHGQRFIVNDDSCSWREFLAPLLSRPADEFASYTPTELAGFGKQNRATVRQVAKSLSGDAKLREWVKDRAWFAPFQERVRHYLQRKSQHPSAGEPTEADSVPPDWLVDLFGPTVTRFSSAKLRGLGWQSKVELTEAHSRTLTWLREMGFRGA